MKRSKLVLAVTSVLIIGLVIGLFVYDSSVFTNLLPPNTIITPPANIFVEPQGYAVGDQWKGSFWAFNVAVTVNDDIAGVILPADQKAEVTYQNAVTALRTGASVEIRIDPEQPYIVRDIQEKRMTVTPGATGGGKTVDSWSVGYYDWSEPTFRIYTPFTVTVFKDGVQVGQATLNAQGSDRVQTISTSAGPVYIESLGVLGGEYFSLGFPDQIAILKGYSNAYSWSQIQPLVNSAVAGSGSGATATTYAAYWFGNHRNAQGLAANPTDTLGFQFGPRFPPSKYGGWEGNDFGASATPLNPVVSSNDKTTLPQNKRSFYSLTEFIEQGKGIQNMASRLFNSRATGDSKALWQKVSFVPASNPTAIQLDIPWSAFGTPLVHIRVPTELADTWIDRPVVTNTQVSASWISTGTKYAELFGSQRIAVEVTNLGPVKGSADLYIESGNYKLGVTPLRMTVNNLEPNVPQVVFFDTDNLGVDEQVDNVPITIIAKDAYTASETGRDTVYGTLKPSLTTGTTTLTLHVVERGTVNPIVGLSLTLQYGNQAPQVFTDANGRVQLTLTTPQGGAYVGPVYVESADTTVYHTASATYNLDAARSHEFTFEVERKDTDYPESFDWMLILLIIAIIVIVIVFVVVIYYYGRKKKKIRVKRPKVKVKNPVRR